MSVIVVMFVLVGSQNAIISGWNNLAACNAARPTVQSFYQSRHGATSYAKLEVTCLELPNK